MLRARKEKGIKGHSKMTVPFFILLFIVTGEVLLFQQLIVPMSMSDSACHFRLYFLEGWFEGESLLQSLAVFFSTQAVVFLLATIVFNLHIRAPIFTFLNGILAFAPMLFLTLLNSYIFPYEPVGALVAGSFHDKEILDYQKPRRLKELNRLDIELAKMMGEEVLYSDDRLTVYSICPLVDHEDCFAMLYPEFYEAYGYNPYPIFEKLPWFAHASPISPTHRELGELRKCVADQDNKRAWTIEWLYR